MRSYNDNEQGLNFKETQKKKKCDEIDINSHNMDQGAFFIWICL